MNNPTGQLLLTTAATQIVEVLLKREDGSAESVADATSATLQIRDSSLVGATVLLAIGSTTRTADQDGFVFALTDVAMTLVPPGRYWGFVDVTVPAGVVSLARPFPIEVVNS